MLKNNKNVLDFYSEHQSMIKLTISTLQKYVPYFRYYKTPLYLFLRPFGHSSRPKTRFFLVSLELLVRLLFKGVLYSRASYNSGNTVFVLTCTSKFYHIQFCPCGMLMRPQGPGQRRCDRCSCTCQFWATGACTRQFLDLILDLLFFRPLFLQMVKFAPVN